jgi:hypothetical protein
MSRKDSPVAYEDVKIVMNLALKIPGMKYECADTGKCVHFKQRCNKYRVMLREQAMELAGMTPGFRPEISYDILVISQTDEDGVPDRHGRFLIFRHQEPLGKITTPDGQEITLENMEEFLDDSE